MEWTLNQFDFMQTKIGEWMEGGKASAHIAKRLMAHGLRWMFILIASTTLPLLAAGTIPLIVAMCTYFVFGPIAMYHMLDDLHQMIESKFFSQELSYTMTLLWIFLFNHKYEIQIALTCASFIGTIVCEAICLSMGFVLGYFSYLIWKRLKVTIPEPLPQ